MQPLQILTYYTWELRFYVTGLRKNKSKVRLVKSSFDQHFPYHSAWLRSLSRGAICIWYWTEMDYFSRKSLSKYLMNTINFNKHDVDIFINGTWQKYAGNIGCNSSKLQGYFNFAFDQREIEVNLHKATSSPSNVSPASRPFIKPWWKKYQPIKLQKTDTLKSISNIGKS